jgi:thymidine kinase
VAGLDLDYKGVPFEPVPQLMAIAEYVSKLHAVCMVCGGPAIHSQRIIRSGKRFLVGSKASYEPRCRHCFKPPKENRPTRKPKEKAVSDT